MKIFGDTHIGEVRKSNQDSFRYRILSRAASVRRRL